MIFWSQSMVIVVGEGPGLPDWQGPVRRRTAWFRGSFRIWGCCTMFPMLLPELGFQQPPESTLAFHPYAYRKLLNHQAKWTDLHTILGTRYMYLDPWWPIRCKHFLLDWHSRLVQDHASMRIPMNDFHQKALYHTFVEPSICTRKLLYRTPM